MSKEDHNVPPTLRTTSSNGSSSSTKKPIEPRLTPRKPESAFSSTQMDNKLQAQASKAAINASSSTSATSSNSSSVATKERISKPHLIQPIEIDDVGIIKTALNDIDDALSNGTLQPLPADLANRPTSKQNIAGIQFDADTARVWWHKLKEMTKFYFFGVTKLGKEHRIIARDVKKRLQESQEQGLNGVNEWRDKEFLSTYKMDLLR